MADSTRAVQYLNSQEEVASGGAQRPTINVPVDVGYNLDRFLKDEHMKSSLSPKPRTETESRARMTAILSTMMLDTAPKQN